MNVISATILLSVAAFAQPFEGKGDIGITPKPGSVTGSGSEFKLTGGGANVWGKADAFFFHWKKITGDITITADVAFEGAGVNAHRKAMLMLPPAARAGRALVRSPAC